MGDLGIKALGKIYNITGDITDAQYARMTDGTVSDWDVSLARSIAENNRSPGAVAFANAVSQKFKEQTNAPGGVMRTIKEDIKDFFAILGE